MSIRGNPSSQLFDLIASKFIANLTKQQLTEQRIGFHFEKAYFYYLDTQGLQTLYGKSDRPKQIVHFCNQLLRVISCPQIPKLTGNQISTLIEENYSTIPVNGIIILNLEETHAILVQSRDNGRFGFPKGKINEGERPEDCAKRQVREQIGINLQLDPSSVVQFQVLSKINNKSYSKNCKFYISKIQKSCIVPRKMKSEQKQQKGIRQILHSTAEIRSVGWYRVADQIPKLIQNNQLNTPSKLAFQYMRRNNKSLNYKQKKLNNPLEQFLGFSENYGKIFTS